MWVWAYRKNRLLVNINTNNGIERQNKTFKYSYLAQRKNTSLSGMLEILIEEFLPAKFERYVPESCFDTVGFFYYGVYG